MTKLSVTEGAQQTTTGTSSSTLTCRNTGERKVLTCLVCFTHSCTSRTDPDGDPGPGTDPVSAGLWIWSCFRWAACVCPALNTLTVVWNSVPWFNHNSTSDPGTDLVRGDNENPFSAPPVNKSNPLLICHHSSRRRPGQRRSSTGALWSCAIPCFHLSAILAVCLLLLFFTSMIFQPCRHKPQQTSARLQTMPDSPGSFAIICGEGAKCWHSDLYRCTARESTSVAATANIHNYVSSRYQLSQHCFCWHHSCRWVPPSLLAASPASRSIFVTLTYSWS